MPPALTIEIETLSRKDTTLAFVLDSLFDGVYIVDRRRRIVFWNRGAEAITGYGAQEVTGRRCADNILNHIDGDGNLLCRNLCPLLRTIRTGEATEAKVYPLHKDGRRFPVMTHIAPLRDETGRVIAGIEIFRDISLEEDYRHLQEKFQTLIKKYVSAATFEEVMAQAKAGAAGGANIRDLTVLFLDIAGFTSFSERRPPQEVVSMLNEVFGVCEVITRECHGDIDKFIGDAVMAVFVDANDAVEASVRILYGALTKMNLIREKDGLESVHIRIGINSGRVIQGDVGSKERKDLTVIGDVVNAAARIQAITDIDTIAVSEATYSRLKEDLAHRFVFLRKTTVKGKTKPVGIFQYRPA
ncbi:MAG TPA: adenylate/guanylate cyclase domain-containing protein [Syntrophales bacterium]|nr:adenylate/guanylate cyclase domain-containing protein [Syntrophales bacterium]HOM06442.1 adenylate/guanylate cyclase domain-containing protein [Syntrophales bacterium]HON99107.1 adenylate/guanylate cyclase domain-containing protein [Syntrophales bacterium]HPC00215.1 adenylate/guanylate cyclase domain-containing protein [Syntrophales bacterium]HPQ05878.1 adenylate/guanylate cyclase domain-containing protein [Syntrophales bacterium]